MKKFFTLIKNIFFNTDKDIYQYSYQNKTTKTVLSATEHLTFSTKTNQIKEQVNNFVEKISKKYSNNPYKLLEYIKNNGTEIYYIKHADKLLQFIGEEEGLIFELNGLKALFICLITKQVLKLHTKPMFIMRNGNIEPFYMLHNFYKWYALKSGLPGFDAKSQKYFKKYLKNVNAPSLTKLSTDEILGLQEAVARDKDATDFVLSLALNQDGAKNVKNKISENGSATI